MSDPEGPWDDATEHDDAGSVDSDQMDGEDPPTTRATLAQQARVRQLSRGAAAPAPAPAPSKPATVPRAQLSSTLPPPSSPDRLPAAPTGSPASKPTDNASPASTATNWPQARSPAPGSASADDGRTTPVTLPALQEENLRKSRGEEPDSPYDEVIVLDKKRPAATPAAGVPVRADGTRNVAVVATGVDADRVKKLCQTHGLVVPILAPIGSIPDDASLVVLGEPSGSPPPRVTHTVRLALPDAELVDLLRSLVNGVAVAEPPTAADDADARVADYAHRIGTLDDRGALEMVTIEAVTALTQADRTQVLFFDPQSGALWSEARRRDGATSDVRRATAGIAGWSAYTGRAVHASPAGDDARYVTAIDDPDGKAQSRLLVQPVIGADRRTHAVLIAARRWRRSDFADTERVALRSLAARIATAVDRVVATHGSAPGKRSTLQGIAAVRPATEPSLESAVVAAIAARPPTGPVPTVPAVPAPPAVPPDAATKSQPPRTRAPSDAGRSRSGSDSPRNKQRAIEQEDPRDVAVLATADDDIARIQRIGRKTRLEVSTLARADEAPPYYRIVTLGEAWKPDTDPRVAYAARSTITDDQLADLLVGLSHDRAPAVLVPVKPQSAAEAKRVQLAVASARQLATAADRAEAETRTIAALRELLDADRAHCMFYTREDGALWSETRRRAGGDDRRAIAGITGWAARTGRAVNALRASADPRWLAPLDDPDGDPNSQLLVQPVIAADRRVLAVLVATRRPKRTPFTELDVLVLEQFAALAGPLIEQLQLAHETQQLLRDGAAGDDLASDPALDSPIRALVRRARALPKWTYAVAGAVLMLLIVLLATTC